MTCFLVGLAVVAAAIYFLNREAKAEAERRSRRTTRGLATVSVVRQLNPSPDAHVRLAMQLAIKPDAEGAELVFTGEIIEDVQVLHASRFQQGQQVVVRFDPNQPANLEFVL